MFNKGGGVKRRPSNGENLTSSFAGVANSIFAAAGLATVRVAFEAERAVQLAVVHNFAFKLRARDVLPVALVLGVAHTETRRAVRMDPVGTRHDFMSRLATAVLHAARLARRVGPAADGFAVRRSDPAGRNFARRLELVDVASDAARSRAELQVFALSGCVRRRPANRDVATSGTALLYRASSLRVNSTCRTQRWHFFAWRAFRICIRLSANISAGGQIAKPDGIY